MARRSPPALTGWRTRTGLLIGLLAACALVTSDLTARPARADVPDVALTSIGTFSAPVYVTSPPGDPTRVFVVERGGLVRVVKNGAVLPTPFIDVSSEISTQNERGLLSIAFSPDYAVSGLVYSFATQTNGAIAVWEHHAAPGADVADAGHRLILGFPHSASNHNGGQLQFGPGGALYVGIGDNADSANGQDTGVPYAKILRIATPSGPAVAPETYAYGLRNPWRFSFDSLTGDLLIADVGDNSWEEIDQLAAGTAAGSNFGWTCWEGTHPHGKTGCSAPGAIPPILEYAHDATHCSITGGFVARDPTVPTLAGRYLYADYCGTGVSAVMLPVTAPADIAQFGTMAHIAGFGSDSDDHLYVTSLDGGVWRVTGTGAADKPPVAAFTLSSTTPAVGASVHLDASASTDPDGKIFSYSWDIDGDGKADGTGVTFDVSYPTAGARPITLTVRDTVGARSTRTQAVYVGGQTTPPGTAAVLTKLAATFTVPKGQTIKSVRKRGLLVRFRSDLPVRWTLTASMRKTAKLHAARLRPAHGTLVRTTFKAHNGTGAVRLHVPAARLANMRSVIIRVQARVQAGGKSLLRSASVRVGH